MFGLLYSWGMLVLVVSFHIYYAGLDQCGAHRVDEYPGHKGVDALGNEVYDIPYNEGLFVGYRFIDKTS